MKPNPAAAVLALAVLSLSPACASGGPSAGSDSGSPAEGTHTTATGTTASPSSAASPVIEDGRNFAFIKSVDTSADPATVTYDLAYFYTGDAANQAAREHGDEVPVPNDVYIVNDNPRLRTVPLASDADLVLIDWKHCCEETFDGDLGTFAKSFDDGPITVAGHRYNGNLSPYWLSARDGVVVGIQEQYIP